MSGVSMSDPAAAQGSTARLLASVEHLIDHIGGVPVHVIPCVEGRTDGKPAASQASRAAKLASDATARIVSKLGTSKNAKLANQFYSALTGSTPLPEFMNQENIARIMASAGDRA